MKAFILGEIITTQWFCYRVTKKNQLHIGLYRANDATRDIMKKYYPGIFCSDWTGQGVLWNQNAEDVCFFKSGKLILGTVSHERICLAFQPQDSSFEKELQNVLNGWATSRNLEEEEIDLGNYNMTFGTL